MKILRPLSPGIGIWELFGPIGGQRRLRYYTEIIETLKNNHRIKSVILNVDSPGGLATASDFLHCSISRLSAQKPVIVFVSGSCASGAYLASCSATRIIALPTAIIGSIGVISARPILYNLLTKIGIRVDVTKSGHLKDMGNFYREPTEEEKKKEEDLIAGFYEYFIKAVAKGRKLEEDKVRNLATGEVFLGEQAKSLGLIDEVGDFDLAVDVATQLGRVRRHLIPVRHRPSLYERLFMRFADESYWEDALVQVEGLFCRRVFYMR